MRAVEKGGPHLRILHLSSLYPPHVVGGAERVVEMLAEQQRAMGHDVAVTYLSKDKEAPGERHGVKTFPVKSSNPVWFDDVPYQKGYVRTFNKAVTVFNLKSTHDFGKVMEEFRADVIHSHSMVVISPMAWKKAKDSGASLVHTLHDYDMLCLRSTLFNGGKNCTSRRMACEYSSRWKATYAPMIDAFVAVSQAVLDEHVARGAMRQVRPERQSVIWNGARLPRLTDATKPARDPSVMTFGFIGRMVPEKGLDVLLAACRRMAPGGFRLKIAGKAPGENDYAQQAEGLPVEFCGFVDPVSFLDTIDVLVVPSIWREPFGLTVVEAMARGVPVLGTDCGAIGELVKTSGLGADWVVEGGNAAQLADRMSAIVAAGHAALPTPTTFDRLLDQITPEHMAESYIDLYQRILANRP